jgi:hypothetical protein
VSDIDTAVVDSLKALDLKRQIREADIGTARWLVPPKLHSTPHEVVDFTLGASMRRRKFLGVLGGVAARFEQR